MSDQPNSLTDEVVERAMRAGDAEYARLVPGQTDPDAYHSEVEIAAFKAALIASGLPAENDILRGDLDYASKLLDVQLENRASLDAELSSLRERLAAAEKDARRYEFMRYVTPVVFVCLWERSCHETPFDKIIDDAIAASQKDIHD